MWRTINAARPRRRTHLLFFAQCAPPRVAQGCLPRIDNVSGWAQKHQSAANAVSRILSHGRPGHPGPACAWARPAQAWPRPRPGWARLGPARPGPAQFSPTWTGQARPGVDWSGPGLAKPGWPRQQNFLRPVGLVKQRFIRNSHMLWERSRPACDFQGTV